MGTGKGTREEGSTAAHTLREDRQVWGVREGIDYWHQAWWGLRVLSKIDQILVPRKKGRERGKGGGISYTQEGRKGDPASKKRLRETIPRETRYGLLDLAQRKRRVGEEGETLVKH